jgi:WD40 repeat protein
MKPLLILLCVLIVCGSARAASSADEIPRYRLLITIERDNVWPTRDFPESYNFSPDGTQFAAAASDTTVNIWDVQTGVVIRTLAYEGLSDPMSVSWSPDGTLIATGSIYSELRVWDVASGSLQYTLGSNEYSTSWSPDSTRLVTADRNIYDAQSGQFLFRFVSRYFEGCQVYWSPDGFMIATTTCHDYDYLTIWSVEDGTLFDTYWGGHSAAWSPDSTRIASDAQVRDISTGLPVTIIPKMGGAIGWHPDGKWIASTGDGHQVSLWDADTGKLLTAWVFSGCEINSFAWSPDGNRFAANCRQIEPKIKNDLLIWERVS